MQSGDDLLSITFETSADTSAVKQYLIERANLEFYEVSSSKVIQKEIDSLKDGIAKIFSFSKFDYIPQIGSALPNDTVAVFKFFKTNLSSNFTSLLGIDYVLKWGVLDREGRMPLYLLKLEDNLKPAMSGNLLISASQGESAFGWITISITMVPSAAKDWELLTGLAYKNASQIAIVLNGVVYSAPGITAGPISGGRSEISGDFSAEEAKEIARKLTMGYLPQLQIVSFQVDSID
jgi:SecD/SecF fusion protein